MEKVLASIGICTYNQEEYVHETISAVLAQTYQPLQIVISDDASTDRTWDIIVETVKKYKENGGVHEVVLNRNEKNLGIMLNGQVVANKVKGEIGIGVGGDDVCMPNRVERIVEEWIKNGKKALAIYHGAWKIDKNGRYMGQLGEFYFREGTLGAVAAYSSELMNIFGPVMEVDAAEDEVYGNRALILNRRLNIRENLLKYRVGVGVSSGRRDYRRKQIRVLRVFKLASMRQTFMDLENVRGLITAERYKELKELFERKVFEIKLWLTLWDDDSLKNRYIAYKTAIKNCSKVRILIATILLLPRRVGDGILVVMNFFLETITRFYYRFKPHHFT